MSKMKKRLSWRLSQWLQSPLSSHIISQEKACLADYLKDRLFSESIVVGEMGHEVFLETINANYKGMIAEHAQPGLHLASIVGKHEELPILSNTVDLMILPHTLDFTKRPHHLLKEADRCLKAESHLVILGFNRFSLWGFRRFLSLRLRAPWCGRYKTVWKIEDWLRLLNYEILKIKRVSYSPPLKPRGFFKYLGWLSRLQATLLPFSSGVYMVVAKKKIYGLTPIKPKWRRAKLVAGRVMKSAQCEVKFEEVRDV
jgi:hypothetical protein